MRCPLRTGSTRCALGQHPSQKHSTQQLAKETLQPDLLHLAFAKPAHLQSGSHAFLGAAVCS